MTGVFYTSDLHLGHAFVAKIRGFANTDEHDRAILAGWRKVVQPGDQVMVLGDIAVSNPDRALALIAALPGTKHLIAGNHDQCHPMHRNAQAMQAKYLTAFATVQPFARRKYEKVDVLLSHFPYKQDHTDEPRHAQYRLPDLGELLVHGHTHSSVQRTSDRELHVGVDAWDFTPVPVSEIVAFVQDVHGKAA